MERIYRLTFLNKALESAFLPVILKILSLVAFILLLIVGFSATSTDTAFLMQLRNTNAGNLIIWSYWWPLIIILAIFFGRIWCMVCPVEIITSVSSRIGLKRKRPAWLLSGWAITTFYFLILFVGIQGFAIHRNPTGMAGYLLIIAFVSVIAGLIWEKNTFCRYVCPVGYLLGIYARLSMIGWRVKDKPICASCRDKPCIQKKYRYNLNYKSCGVDLYPAKIIGNSDCILCAGCLKTCGRYQVEPNPNRPNTGFVVTGFARELFQLRPLRIPEMVFVMLLSGFVFSEIWTEWPVTAAFLQHITLVIAGWFPFSGTYFPRFVYSVLIFLILPAILWLIPFLAVRSAGGILKLKSYLLSYGVTFIPVIAAAHLAKAILKTTSRVIYFSYLPDDLSGMSTAKRILDNEIILSGQPGSMSLTVWILIFIVMLAGILLSTLVVKKFNALTPRSDAKLGLYLIPFLYGGIFMGMIIAWGWVIIQHL